MSRIKERELKKVPACLGEPCVSEVWVKSSPIYIDPIVNTLLAVAYGSLSVSLSIFFHSFQQDALYTELSDLVVSLDVLEDNINEEEYGGLDTLRDFDKLESLTIVLAACDC
jgi:hypothetical protein